MLLVAYPPRNLVVTAGHACLKGKTKTGGARSLLAYEAQIHTSVEAL